MLVLNCVPVTLALRFGLGGIRRYRIRIVLSLLVELPASHEGRLYLGELAIYYS
jgi:hypothetical protein